MNVKHILRNRQVFKENNVSKAMYSKMYSKKTAKALAADFGKDPATVS